MSRAASPIGALGATETMRGVIISEAFMTHYP
jgi:hypothetical protein